MTAIRLDAYDESGIIGGNLRFVKVSLDNSCILRPFIYNILHFNSLAVTKGILKGQRVEDKKKYMEMILNDPAIEVDQFLFSPDHQLEVLRKFTMGELSRMYGLRGKLIEGFMNPAVLNSKASEVSNYCRRFIKPDRYVEIFMKSYGYRMIIDYLSLDGKFSSSKVLSLVDGGFPLVFWAPKLTTQTRIDGLPFSSKAIPILGITNGDEYFPTVSLAGNIAYIINQIPGMIFPYTMKDIPRMDEDQLNKFCKKFSESYGEKRFFRRVLFIGHIDRDLQYSIPFLQYLDTGEILEAFRVKWSFNNFNKEFGLSRRKDTVVVGKIRNQQDNILLEECKSLGLEVVEINNFKDSFESFLDNLLEGAKISNLDADRVQKVEKIIELTKNRVKNT